MQTTKIVDLVEGTANKKPIELIYCLQSTFRDGVPQYCKIDGYKLRSDRVKQVTRLGQVSMNCIVYDIVKLDTISNTSEPTYWVGKWNDGIME